MEQQEFKQNEARQNENKLGDLLEILKKCWWVMLIVFALASTTTYIYSNVTYQPQYTATVSIWVLKNVGTESGFQATDVSVATYLVNDYRELLTSDAVVDRVQKSSPTFEKISIAALRSSVSVSHIQETRILTLSATANSKEGAKKLADTWGNTFCTYINDEKMNGEQMVTYDDALTPINPSNPISFSKILLMGILAAALAYAVFFVRFVLDDKINSADDVEKYLGLTVLGAIPNKNAVVAKRGKYRYFKHNKYYGSSKRKKRG